MTGRNAECGTLSAEWKILLIFAVLSAFMARPAAAAAFEGFETDKSSGEQHRTLFFDSGARATILAPADFNPERETHLLIFALPNGNTIEQTIGCKSAPGLDWH